MGMTLEQMMLLEPTEAEVWERARKDYEDGVPVGDICARYGLARATVYQRAQVWRAAGGAVDLEAPSPKAEDLAEIAWRRMAMCVEAGRVQEALCWRSLVETLEKRAAKAAWAQKVQGMSVEKAAEVLIAECDRTVAEERAQRAFEAEAQRAGKGAARAAPTSAEPSLDTPLPLENETREDEAEPLYTPEQVREWRAWAAFSERFLPDAATETEIGGEAARPTPLPLWEREGPASRSGVGG